MTNVAALPVDGAGDPFWTYWEQYERHLEAEERSPKTVLAYRNAATQLRDWLVERHAPTDPVELRRAHLEEHVIYLRNERGMATATIRLRYAALHNFFSWLVEEEPGFVSPMVKMKPPKVDDPPPAVLRPEQLQALLAACSGGDFYSRRDAALIRFYIDSGLRRTEALNVKLADLNQRERTVRVVRKGGHVGTAFYGARTGRDIDRYLRVRAKQSAASSAFLWLPGTRGGDRLSEDGLLYMLRRRGEQAGIQGLHPHMFRHSFADSLKSQGASDEDVMTSGGWRDAKVMRRYGAARAVDRAREMHRRLSPGDRL